MAKLFCEKSKREQKEVIHENIKKCNDFLEIIAKSPETNAKGDWRHSEASLILKARVLCTTLSMAGIERLEALKGHVDYLIVDEAC